MPIGPAPEGRARGESRNYKTVLFSFEGIVIFQNGRRINKSIK